MNPLSPNLQETLDLLDINYKWFIEVKDHAKKFCHPWPNDTRSWSQLIVSALVGIKGKSRKKGTDFDDGSDVKGANIWDAIDTPRFNSCIKAGTKNKFAGKLESLDSMPYLFFILWDYEPFKNKERCRIWVVLPSKDPTFRKMCNSWYDKKVSNNIKSNNFQLHPPRNKNSNEFRNKCGNLEYPLLFESVRENKKFVLKHYDSKVLGSGTCKKVS